MVLEEPLTGLSLGFRCLGLGLIECIHSIGEPYMIPIQCNRVSIEYPKYTKRKKRTGLWTTVEILPLGQA